MDKLFFLTDRYPYEDSESFIENEIQFLADRFDEVYIIPTALTVNAKRVRPVPENVYILKPANTDNLYRKDNLTKIERIRWSIKYMLPWCVSAVISRDFISGIRDLINLNIFEWRKIIPLIRTIAPKIRNRRHFKRQFQKINLEEDNDYYVYSYWLTAFVTDIAYYTGIKNFRKIVSRAHRFEIYDIENKYKYIPLRKNTLQYVDNISFISQNGYEYMLKKYNEFSMKMSVHYLGTKDYGIGNFDSELPFTIVSCSAVVPIKRVNRIVDVLEKFKGIKLQWFHFGGGKNFEELNSYAAERLGFNPDIKYKLVGQVSNKQLMDFYKRSSVNLFVNVSENEGLPVSIMEAISFGIPVIATDVGGTKEAFDSDSCQFLLPKEFDNNQLYQMIYRFITMDIKEYIQMREQARQRWEKMFSAYANYNIFIEDFFGKKF